MAPWPGLVLLFLAFAAAPCLASQSCYQTGVKAWSKPIDVHPDSSSECIGDYDACYVQLTKSME